MVFTSAPPAIINVAVAWRQPWVGCTPLIPARRMSRASRSVRLNGRMGAPPLTGNRKRGPGAYSLPHASACSSTRAFCARSNSTTAAGMDSVRRDSLVLVISRTITLDPISVTVRATLSVPASRSSASASSVRPSNSDRRNPLTSSRASMQCSSASPSAAASKRAISSVVKPRACLCGTLGGVASAAGLCATSRHLTACLSAPCRSR